MLGESSKGQEHTEHKSKCIKSSLIEGAPPIAAEPGRFPDFQMFGFSKMTICYDCPVEFGVWEGLQSMGNGCGLKMDGFSTHFDPSEFIFHHFHDFCDFVIVSACLMLFPEGPRTLRDRSEGSGTL